MSTEYDARIRIIKIKSGIVKRLAKEVLSYQKESLQEEERLTKMKSDENEESRLKLQEKVIQESRMMIPDSRQRLRVAWEDLKAILDAETDLEENEYYLSARTILDEAQLQMAS